MRAIHKCTHYSIILIIRWDGRPTLLVRDQAQYRLLYVLLRQHRSSYCRTIRWSACNVLFRLETTPKVAVPRGNRTCDLQIEKLALSPLDHGGSQHNLYLVANRRKACFSTPVEIAYLLQVTLWHIKSASDAFPKKDIPDEEVTQFRWTCKWLDPRLTGQISAFAITGMRQRAMKRLYN